MVKTTFRKFLFTVVCFFIVSHIGKIEAQIVIGKPNLEFSQACANESFNTFETTFLFSPESGIEPSNQFIVEMSDKDGSFDNSEIVFTSDVGSITTSPATVSFALPTTTAGEGYKLRIKSTYPATTSTASDSFAAYYKIQDSPFTINNLVSTASFCPGGSYLLTIDNPGTSGNDSPLNYPSLTFKWFKEINSTTSVFIAEGSTLSVTEVGIYFVETNYGTCTSDSFSNRVTISEATSGEVVDATIVSSSGNPFCAANGPTTLSTPAGSSYQWLKDGNLITGATNQTYETDLSGVYSVVVGFGSCEATGSIELQTGDFLSNLNVPAVNSMEAGNTLDVEVTTDAINPEFQWFFNNEMLTNATQSSFNVTDFGDYKVMISQTSDCAFTQELTFQVNEFVDPFPDVANIPNIVSPNGDGINDTWVIPTAYVSGTNTEVIIYSNRGETILSTKDYLNNWPEEQPNLSSVNEVFYYMIIPPDSEPRKGSITLIK